MVLILSFKPRKSNWQLRFLKQYENILTGLPAWATKTHWALRVGKLVTASVKHCSPLSTRFLTSLDVQASGNLGWVAGECRLW